MMEATVELKGITKVFGSFTALDNVSFVAKKGQIQALVGENGAGKTTLLRVLFGLYQADGGEVLVKGQPCHFRNPKQALAAGVGMVSQHYAIIPELTCLQNLMLGAEPGEVLDLGAAKKRADELAAKLDFRFNWDQVAGELGPGDCQKLEILKLLWRNTDIMILDEPTAMLSPADSDALFESLSKLAEEGATVILVTHRLPEVLEHCAEVTVLRGGKWIAAQPVAGLTGEKLAEMIVGKSLARYSKTPATPGEIVLKLDSLSVLGDRGNLAVDSASLELRQGELVGLAGVDGNGQRELFQALLGVRPAKAGTVQYCGENINKTKTSDRLSKGIRLIAEDRYAEAMIADWSLIENGILGFQDRVPFRNGWQLDRSHARERASHMAERFGTKFQNLEQPIGDLSGGNQQRFIAARAMEGDPKLLLAFQPTRGLDIEATRTIYSHLKAHCMAGGAAIAVSFDLDELLQFCDRVVVMNHGRVYHPQAMDRSEIGRLMVGAD